jgi:hypothetical protein
MKAEEKGISPQRHKDQHKGPLRRQKDKGQERRVQKTEARRSRTRRKQSWGHVRASFVPFLPFDFCLLNSLAVFFVALCVDLCAFVVKCLCLLSFVRCGKKSEIGADKLSEAWYSGATVRFPVALEGG